MQHRKRKPCCFIRRPTFASSWTSTFWRIHAFSARTRPSRKRTPRSCASSSSRNGPTGGWNRCRPGRETNPFGGSSSRFAVMCFSKLLSSAGLLKSWSRTSNGRPGNPSQNKNRLRAATYTLTEAKNPLPRTHRIGRVAPRPFCAYPAASDAVAGPPIVRRC